MGAGRDDQGVSVREGIVVVLKSRVTAMGQCISLVKKNPGPSRASPFRPFALCFVAVVLFLLTNVLLSVRAILHSVPCLW